MRLNKGFTIIELLIVIVIIGILVAITAVSYTGITNGANTAANQANAKSIKQGLTACHAKNGVFPAITLSAINACSNMTMPSTITIGTPSAETPKVISAVGVDATGVATVTYWDYTIGNTVTL